MGLSGLRPLLRLEDCRVRAGTGLNPAGLGGTAGRWPFVMEGFLTKGDDVDVDVDVVEVLLLIVA